MTFSHIENLRYTKLVETSFAQNRMELIEKGVLKNMPSTLEKLSLALNRLTTGIYLFEFSFLRKLKEFNMTLLLKPITNFPEVFEECIEKKDFEISVLVESSKIKYQEYSKKQIKRLNRPNITVYIPPNLVTVYANSSKLYGGFPKVTLNATKLRNIYVQNNLFFSWDKPVFGLELVENLDLSDNFCSRISPRFTASGTGLKYLNIARNFLSRPIQMDIRCHLFKYQRNLEEFDLSNNRLFHLPICTFQNMVKLRILKLNHNQLTGVNFRLRHMTNLSYIDLSDNRLTGFTNETMHAFSYIFKKSKVSINLLRNNLYCRCQNLKFLTWLYENRMHFLGFQKYTCSDRSNQFNFHYMEQSLQKLKLDCIDYDVWIITTTVSITLVISVLLVIIIRKNIWHIRYFLHKSKRHNDGFTSTIKEEELSNLLAEPDLLSSIAEESFERTSQYGMMQGQRQYFFHAFISYVGENRGFVFQKMKPKLEAKGLRLLIRDIHFEIGNSKIDNIMKAIGRSQRTICVVSKAYLKSKWRTYELNMAKMEALKERGSLGYVCLILMPDLFEGGCDTAIKDFIEEKHFLDYPPEDSSLQDEFWENLTRIIKNS
ncbi:toll-like receptor 4 [Saccostrea cucullata]|uniref:toll-like receptor 4 n=1 Tax=Saccostrea cuccullata TaxID=36930 RepID=UPI002ED5CF2D